MAFVVSIISVGFATCSTFFLSRGGLGLAPPVIAELASTKWNYNLEVAESLASQRSNTEVGFTLLILAVALQLLQLSLLPQMPYEPSWEGAFAAGAIVLAVGVLGLLVGKRRRRQIQSKVLLILKGRNDGAA